MASRMGIWITVLLGVCVCVLAAPREDKSFDTVDRAAIMREDFTHFIENVDWPLDEVIAAKRVTGASVKTDIDKFEELLQGTLRKEVLPSRATIDAGVLALEALRDGNDYLLLRYEAPDYQFQVQDGKALYILVTPREREEVSLDEIGDFVRSTALSVLNVPKVDEKGVDPIVSVSGINVGLSRCGTLYYRASFVPPPPKFWYSHMRWWSDGRHVLLLTTKGLRHGEDLSKMAAPRPGADAPRLFEYKMAAAAQKATN